MTLFNRVVVLAGVLASAACATASAAQQDQAAKPPRARVQGVVWDSTRNAPLAMSVVQMVHPEGLSSPRSTVADSAGRFVFDRVAAGVWVVGVRHPRLDTLALEDVAQRVQVKSRGTAKVRLSVPSGASLSRQVCGAAPQDSTGYLFGRMRRAEGDRRAIAGMVRVEWHDLVVKEGRLSREVISAVAQGSDSGNFVVCGVPVSASTRVQAWSADDSTGAIDVKFPPSGISRLDLFVGQTQYVRQAIDSTVAPGDASPTVVLRTGSGRVIGMVRDRLDQPIRTASASIPGSGQMQRTSATGRFEITGVATGTQLLDVRAIGYEQLRIPIDVFGNDSTVTTFALSRVTTLAKVDVRAFRAAVMGQDMVDFENRRRLGGFGRYFGPDDMIALNPLYIRNILTRVPGVRVVNTGVSGDQVLMRGVMSSAWCTPEIWLDGYRITNDGSIDAVILPQELRAIEVYTRPTGVPVQYVNIELCGTILLWSGPREIPGAKRR